MTTFVRRVPDTFDEAYWHASSRYMERELGAVPADEAERHENPSGFTDPSGNASGQRKDMSYCFAPYDGLRGLGMSDVREFSGVGDLPPGVRPIDVSPNFDPEAQKRALEAMRLGGGSGWKKTLPYIAVGGGLLALLLLTRKP